MLVTSNEIAVAFGWKLRGKNMPIRFARSLAAAESGALVFLSKETSEGLASLFNLEDVTCITTSAISNKIDCSVIEHDNPRLAFALVVARFFVARPPALISDFAIIDKNTQIGEEVEIGPGCVIKAGVRIGAKTRIHSQVVIEENSIIGTNCIIKSNTTIGESGFGFVKNEVGVPIHFPHLGYVEIGNGVEIGANCTVVRAALERTVIEDHVKTDDHVHIAHNCIIGSRTQIAAGAIISGSVTIGSDVWIGPNATIGDYVNVAFGARIGIGSVILRDVEPWVTMIGNPARIAGRKII